MEINKAAPQPLYTARNDTSSSGGSQLSSDFETFLKMLTVQMQHQDPLNPMDSSEYALQLATFSSVEQQVMTNDLLTGLGAQLAAQGMGQMSSWVGLEARSTAPAYFNGDPVQLSADFPLVADQAVLVVRDDADNVIARQTISPDEITFEWNGMTEGGNVAPAGNYSFEVEISAEGEALDPVQVQTYNRVDEVRLEAAGTQLVLAGGTVIPATSVTALRSEDA